MVRLEAIQEGAFVVGLDAQGPAEIVKATAVGTNTLQVYYRDTNGTTRDRILFRDDEAQLSVIDRATRWTFLADPALTKLAAEAQRIRFAYTFDPLLAIHSSDVEPLPHQITAVYESMLPRQPLRFLLADDPGAGKTVMTGLLMKELALRGDLDRCLIVCPGGLTEQWQDELNQKFGLKFEIFTRDQAEASLSGNWFAEHAMVICRLDQLSRNDDYKDKLSHTDWDLIVVDEAHKMSATFYGHEGRELDKTARYRLGELLGRISRHFLLLSATPHNGKEEDFQLFMALLDPDRFEGKYDERRHSKITVDDLMRRMVKEQLVRMDGRPLFPERFATTIPYDLSDVETELYEAVTAYVREEFNRADAIQDKNRKGTVGFALTVLQRRLASSPEAIYQSLCRRHERLQKRLEDEQTQRQGHDLSLQSAADDIDAGAIDLDDLDEGLVDNLEDVEDQLLDRSTAAKTLAELRAEIAILAGLIRLADAVRKSGRDRKWEELSSVLQDTIPEMEQDATRRKLVVFTEHRDTLTYLHRKITNLYGTDEALVAITGGMSRDERRRAQEAFTQDSSVQILLATDAAGEGINLQRAHLMVNYDLPWNPNRLEQRFGRIHRIGQREVCHLWNMVARETREGQVYLTLLRKLEQERNALGGKVFDVLGKLQFGEGKTLRNLLVDAIRYGDRPDVRQQLERSIEGAVNADAITRLLSEHALFQPEEQINVKAIAEQMERANARRLQPHYISAFFQEAFRTFGGHLRLREPGRYEIRFVPTALIEESRGLGRTANLIRRYDRITFDRKNRVVGGRPLADLVAPGHPLLDTVITRVLREHGDLLQQGTVLIDRNPDAPDLRLLYLLDHEIQDGRTNHRGEHVTVSRRMQFVELTEGGDPYDAGPAPYLDYAIPEPDQRAAITAILQNPWLHDNPENIAQNYATSDLAPKHLAEVKARTDALVDRIASAVHRRLEQEIMYWDGRFTALREDEARGKQTRLPAEQARQRRDDLRRRQKARAAELQLQKQLIPRMPVIRGAMVIIAEHAISGMADPQQDERRRIERLAMDAVMRHERTIGNLPRDVSRENVGYDIESIVPGAAPGTLRFIEVKGRTAGADSVTLTRNEILTGLNQPDAWILAVVDVNGTDTATTYFTRPIRDRHEPAFDINSINYNLSEFRRNAATVEEIDDLA